MVMDLRCPDQACRNYLVKEFDGNSGEFRCSKCGITVKIMLPAARRLLTPSLPSW